MFSPNYLSLSPSFCCTKFEVLTVVKMCAVVIWVVTRGLEAGHNAQEHDGQFTDTLRQLSLVEKNVPVFRHGRNEL
jgi:hypothetical protein